MLPGKTYTPEDVLLIARKRIWFLLVPLALVSAGTALWAGTLPNLYRAETSVLVVPQGVPENYVRSTITTRIEDRLESIKQQILSRPKLEGIIAEFDLYAEERKSGIMEDIVDRMRNEFIQTRIRRDDEFTIAFVGSNPKTVAKVTERLASLFINENLEDRSRMAQSTSSFLENRLEDTKRRLMEQEKQVEEYRRRYAGQLPSQLASNLQVLQSSYLQAQQVAVALDRDRDKQANLERDIAALEQQIEDDPGAPLSGELAAAAESPLERQLAAKRAELARLGNKTESYPGVKKLKAEIAELEAQIAGLPAAAVDTLVSPNFNRVSSAEAARRKALDDMRTELARVKKSIAYSESEAARLQKEIAAYQARNEAIPTRENEMTEMLRDYGTIQSQYTSLLAKREDSNMAASLETRQMGERFRVYEPARVPERPFSPNRQRMILMSFVVGLGIGALLVALFEYLDRSFKTDEELSRVLTLPVLAVVPRMQSGAEHKRELRNRVLMNVGFGTTVLACLAVVAYTLVH